MKSKTVALLGVMSFALVLTTTATTPQGKGKGSTATSVYTAQCAKCHGADGKGIPSLGEMPNFTDANWQSSRTDKQVSDGIANGAGVMPGFKESLSAAQITALVKYVRAFSPKAAKKK